MLTIEKNYTTNLFYKKKLLKELLKHKKINKNYDILKKV